MLLRHRLAIDKGGIGTLQRGLALLSPLLCCLKTLAHQNFTQITDSEIYRGRQVNLAINAVVHAIVAKLQYFGAHASLPNQSLAK